MQQQKNNKAEGRGVNVGNAAKGRREKEEASQRGEELVSKENV